MALIKRSPMIKKFILIILLLNNYALGGTTRPEVPDSEYVKYGSLFQSVVKISGVCFLENGKEAIGSGSGVVISEHWVLTAAHVLQTINDPYFYIKEKKYIIKKTIINKEFDINKAMCCGDIALCYVEEEIKLNFYPQLYENNDEINKICSISGYGLHGTAITGAVRNDENRRAGSNKILLVTECALICDMSKKNPTSLEFLPAHGDSGGGLFIDGKLAGINSFVSSSDGKTDSNYGDESGHTRISKYKIWIDFNIKYFKD
jgi:hypothetical protein